MRSVPFVTIMEILRLSDMGLSLRQISQSTGCAKSTIGDVMSRCKQAGLDYGKVKAMTPDEVQKLLYPASTDIAARKVEPDWAEIHAEMAKNKSMNIQYIWEEYRKTAPDGLGYSQFCERYRRYRKAYGKGVTMHQEREPGDVLEVDWMGDILPCVRDTEIGETIDAHFFACVLGDSGMPFVQAYPDETQPNWLDAHVKALEYYGGSPRIIRPDNCRTAVKLPKYRDIVINSAYGEFAEHYGVAVVPARIRRPGDKSLVESTIGWLETWLLNTLRNQSFYSFTELNAAIMKRVGELSLRNFTDREGTRRSVFEEVDKPALKPLPAKRYEYADIVARRVGDSYTVKYDQFYYSVPYTLHKQIVSLRVTQAAIEIFDARRNRVASHVRRYTGRRYVVKREHMPPAHVAYLLEREYDGDRYREWAKHIGENTFTVIENLLNSKTHEEEAYRSCMGILHFAKAYGSNYLEMACRKAIKMGVCSYTDIENILRSQKASEVAKSVRPTPEHENIRGSANYR